MIFDNVIEGKRHIFRSYNKKAHVQRSDVSSCACAYPIYKASYKLQLTINMGMGYGSKIVLLIIDNLMSGPVTRGRYIRNLHYLSAPHHKLIPRNWAYKGSNGHIYVFPTFNFL
jgi:hypothetical protein